MHTDHERSSIHKQVRYQRHSGSCNNSSAEKEATACRGGIVKVRTASVSLMILNVFSSLPITLFLFPYSASQKGRKRRTNLTLEDLKELFAID